MHVKFFFEDRIAFMYIVKNKKNLGVSVSQCTIVKVTLKLKIRLAELKPIFKRAWKAQSE